MTWSRSLIVISNLCVLGLFGWTLYASRKPLCIDSTVVEKIDVVTSQGLESVFACRMQEHVPFSPYLYEMIPLIESRIQKVEQTFRATDSLAKPVKIEVFLKKPWTFGVLDHSIYIGEQMLLSEGHLEKALLKIWYRERQNELFVHSNLAEEMITDFLLYLTKGQIGIEDRYFGYRTKTVGVRWPHVMKSAQGYCDSPWKASEDYNVCVLGKNLPEFLGGHLLQLSLRPLVSAAFIESYQELDFFQKNEFLRNLSEFVLSERIPPLPAVAQDDSSALMMGQEVINNIKRYIFQSNLAKSLGSYKILSKHVLDKLFQKGFQDASGEVHFDFVYESLLPLDVNSELFKSLQKVSEDQPDLQIAATDGKKIWFLPSKYPLEMSLIKGLRSFHRVVETCGQFNFDFVLRYAGLTDKLMAIESCRGVKPEKIESYFQEGAEGFARNNRKLSFVQFHVPSLILKSDVIPRSQDVISLIQDRDLANPIFKVLGWQDLRFEKAVGAYRPRAHVEAIQWFRF